jgi:hypothetical protein
MLRSLKVISMIALTITTVRILPSYASQSSKHFDVLTSSFSNYQKSDLTSVLLAQNTYSEEKGREIDSKAEKFLVGSAASLALGSGRLPMWQHLSDEQKHQFAQAICDSPISGSNLVEAVLQRLGSHYNNWEIDLRSAGAITLASMHTLCYDRYRQEIQNLANDLLRD